MSTGNDEIDPAIARQSVYSGDAARVTIKGYKPTPTPVPFGTLVEGVHFDGYPQIVKHAAPAPIYAVKKQKNRRKDPLIEFIDPAEHLQQIDIAENALRDQIHSCGADPTPATPTP